MERPDFRIVLSFSPEDQTWLRLSAVSVPKFWQGHQIAPATGDALRIGGRQFIIQGRVWEHEDGAPLLRLMLSGGHAESDTVFG
jgi:hypothetical protein